MVQSVSNIVYFVSGVVLISLMSCQQQNEQLPAVDQLYKEYQLQPTPERASVYLDTLSSFIQKNVSKESLIQPYLINGVQVSMAQGQLSKTPGYILPLLRLYPDLENRKGFLSDLGDVMYALRKRHASGIIYSELSKSNPNDEGIAQRMTRVDTAILNHEDYLEHLFNQILINPDQFGVNKEASLKYVDGVEAMALVSPDNATVPGHLYRAAEVARSLRTFPKAMSLYDWLIEVYPQHEKAPTALFIKGFILEQDYERIDEAREVYSTFLQNYPNHEMAESASFLLENLGKSDQEILQAIEANRQNQGQ